MIALDLPDLPRWVEAHGIASDPEAWSEGYALGHDAAKLIVVIGDPEPDAVTRLATTRPSHAILFAIEREDLAAALRVTGRVPERAILHTLADPEQLPDSDGAVPLDAPVTNALRPKMESGGLAPTLGAELAWARSRGPVWSAWVDGEPVSFAYAPWRSAAWFDVSVDTLADARQLGLATIVAAAMIRDERARGREPVWGADEGNVASLRLAKRLGFDPIDELWVAAGR